MTRHIGFCFESALPKRWMAAALTAMACAFIGTDARAVGLNYVEASDLINLTPLTAINSAGPGTDADALWGFRSDFGSGLNVFQSGANEDSPQLTQLITGLNPGGSYDVYAVYWTDKDENWTINTGVSPGSLTAYSFMGNSGPFPRAGTTRGVSAGGAAWDTLPLPNKEGTYFTERPADPLIMLLAKAGTASANGAGELNVYIDDNAISGSAQRTWFDGVAYVNAGTPVALTATLNRTTGNITLNNPTSNAFQIKSVTISSATGALAPPAWSPITGNLDGAGNDSFDADDWQIVAPVDLNVPYTVELTERESDAGGGSGGTLAAGGSLNFGNIWHRSPERFEDVRIQLTMTDDSLAIIAPATTGAAFAVGDFNVDGAINTTDYQTLVTNMHTSATGIVAVAAYQRGDLVADGQINFSDFVAFRTAYDAANGAGAFAAMAGVVPEPSSLAILAIAGGLALVGVRRRAATCALALAFCLAVSGSASAQTLLAVDVNDRTDGDPLLDTQTGFEPFVVTPAGTASVTTLTTQAVGAYTVTLAPFDDLLDENSVTAGIQSTTGAVDDRERAVPTDTGALTYSALYKDFVFAGGSTGPTGGMDLTISGGALQPNKAYSVSIYAWDQSSSGARAANWFDATSPGSPILSAPFTGAAANSPTTNNQYRFTGIAQTDGTGKLTLNGRSASGYATGGTVTNAVFLNGFEVQEFTGLTLEVNTTNGAVRITNEQPGSLSLGYYEIRSAAGSLNLGSWSSFDNAEGADPVGTGWDEASGSSVNILSEMNLTGSTAVAAGGLASLGSAFTVGGTQDLRFFYAGADDTALTAGFVKYVTGGGGIVADFNNSGVVDAGDLTEWKADFGQGAGSDADSDGDTDGADFLIWQRRYGATSAAAATGAVPEPAAASLLALAGMALLGCRRAKR